MTHSHVSNGEAKWRSSCRSPVRRCLLLLLRLHLFQCFHRLTGNRQILQLCPFASSQIPYAYHPKTCVAFHLAFHSNEPVQKPHSDLVAVLFVSLLVALQDFRFGRSSSEITTLQYKSSTLSGKRCPPDRKEAGKICRRQRSTKQ